MIVVAGSLVIDPAERDAYLADCREVVLAAVEAPGCLDFSLAPDPVDPARIRVFERWASQAELDAFRGSGPEGGSFDRLREIDVAEYDARPRG